MKFYIFLLFCLISFKGYAQEEEFNLLINDEIVADNSTWEKILEENYSLSKDYSIDSDSLSVLSNLLQEQTLIQKGNQSIITYAVAVVISEGYTFHVADYADGSRVITCLDGGMRGYQGIYYNGALVVDSTNVCWYKNSFVHQYPGGKITSYSNKQIADLK